MPQMVISSFGIHHVEIFCCSQACSQDSYFRCFCFVIMSCAIAPTVIIVFRLHLCIGMVCKTICSWVPIATCICFPAWFFPLTALDIVLWHRIQTFLLYAIWAYSVPVFKKTYWKFLLESSLSLWIALLSATSLLARKLSFCSSLRFFKNLVMLTGRLQFLGDHDWDRERWASLGLLSYHILMRSYLYLR